jgi:thiol-disulfide isomerase/thioredoxin
MSETPSRRGPKAWILALTATLVWVVFLYFVGPRMSVSGSFEKNSVRYPADYNWDLHDQDDKPIRFETFKGKTIFLNIWATWCPPCVAEMPSIARLAENPRLKGKGIEFICVATDDSASPVRQYLQGKNWEMTFLRADSLPRAYLTEGIPATYAISPEGVVVGMVEGASDWDNAEVVEFLEKLAKPQSK